MVISMSIDLREVRALQRDLKQIQRDYPKLGEQIRYNLAERTKRYAKANIQPKWPGSTGRLKQSIIMRKEDKNRTTVMAMTPYAGYVEFGTKPHAQPNSIIEKFRKHGHPDEKNYPSKRFMSRAFEQMMREAGSVMRTEVDAFFKARRL